MQNISVYLTISIYNVESNYIIFKSEFEDGNSSLEGRVNREEISKARCVLSSGNLLQNIRVFQVINSSGVFHSGLL
jgi:hypothetical protein